MPSLLYLTGFEHGTQLVGGSGSGLSVFMDNPSKVFVEAGAARSGGYGLRLVQDTYRVQFLNPNNSPVVVGSFYWRAVTKPATGATIARCEAATHSPEIGYNGATNKINVSLGGASVDAASRTVTTNQWYLIEFRINLSGTTWTMDWSIDGISESQVTLPGQIADAVTRFEFTCDSTPTAATWNYDDLMISATSADYPLTGATILGATADQAAAAEHQAITLWQWQYTDDMANWSLFASQTETDSRSRIDDLSTTDGIAMSVSTPIDGNARWPVADTVGDPGTAPIAVSLITASRESDATGLANNAVFRTYLGGSTADHFSGNPTWGTTWYYLRSVMNTRPGGGAWTNQNAKDIRFESDSSDASPAIWLAGFFYEIAYAASPGSASASPSASMSPSASVSPSPSASLSPSASPSPSGGAAPLAPVLNSPNDGVIVTSLTPTLCWTGTDPNADPMTYEIQIDPNPFGMIWGICNSVNLPSQNRLREFQDAVEVGCTATRIDGSDKLNQGNLARQVGLNRWVYIVGAFSTWPDPADAIAYAAQFPEAWLEPLNEPNNGQYVADVANEQKAFYAAVKAANPNTVVLMASIMNSASTPEGLLPLQWAQGLVANGCTWGTGFDVANYHAYGPDPAGYDTWQHIVTPDGNGNSMQKVFGYPPWIMTEFGFPLIDSQGGNHTEAEQAAACTAWMNWIPAQANSLGGMWYALSDDAPGSGQNFGLRRLDLTHRPSWSAFQAIATA